MMGPRGVPSWPPGPNSELRLDSPDGSDAADVGDARLCSAVEVTCDSTVCVFVAADVPVSWLTVAAGAAPVVVCGAGLNLGNAEVTACAVPA